MRLRQASLSYETASDWCGGKGIVAMMLTEEEMIVGFFPVEDGDEVMLVVIDAGKLIRTLVSGIASRAARRKA